MVAAALFRKLARFARNERGMALPTAMFATVASLGLAGAAVMSSVDVQRGSQRDSGSKSAIAAADAGANVAMMRVNREREELADEPCLDEADPAGGWCPPVTGTVGTASYSYRVSEAGVPCADGQFDLCISVVGTSGEVSRRILLTFDQGLPGPGGGSNEEEEENEGEEGGGGGGGGEEGVIGVDSLTIYNNADARVSVGTNGNITLENNADVCGNIRYGIGKEKKFTNNWDQCDGYTITQGNATVPPVSEFMPADIATNNSNYRLVKCTKTSPVKEPAGCQSDGFQANGNKTWGNTVPWNATTRTISASNNATLTLGGGDYFICRLELSNNVDLIMAEGAKVRLFFDTPENCGLKAGTKQIYIHNNAAVTATGYRPSEGKFDMPGFFLLGSPTIPTSVEWRNNSGNTNELVIYAPNSNVVLENNADFIGVVVGKTVLLENNVVVEQDDGFVLPPWLDPWAEEEEEQGGEEEEEDPPTPGFYTPQYYVECTGAAAATPDASC